MQGAMCGMPITVRLGAVGPDSINIGAQVIVNDATILLIRTVTLGFGLKSKLSQKAHWQIEGSKNRHAVGVSGGHYRNLGFGA